MQPSRPLRLVLFGAVLAIVGVAASFVWQATSPRAADDAALTPANRDAVERIIREYLRDNPDVVIDAIRTYQARQATIDEAQAAARLDGAREALERDPATPVAGNPDGDVTIVEFFDYRCGYCAKVLPAIQALIAADPGIRYVFKEYPILGPDSVTAARASLAVWKLAPERYMDFHSALLTTRGSLNEARILKLAESLGLDVAALKATMSEGWVEAAIQANYQLGRILNINGTPAFIVGDEVVPGAIGIEQLQELVKRARTG